MVSFRAHGWSMAGLALVSEPELIPEHQTPGVLCTNSLHPSFDQSEPQLLTSNSALSHEVFHIILYSLCAHVLY